MKTAINALKKIEDAGHPQPEGVPQPIEKQQSEVAA